MLETLIPTRDITTALRITSRQLDYWVAHRYIRTASRRGPKNTQLWHPDEVRVIGIMQRLILAGLPAPAASVYARLVVDERQTEFRLGAGITLTISMEGSS